MRVSYLAALRQGGYLVWAAQEIPSRLLLVCWAVMAKWRNGTQPCGRLAEIGVGQMRNVDHLSSGIISPDDTHCEWAELNPALRCQTTTQP